MFINWNLSRFFLGLVFVAVKANYVTINWNISTNRGNSNFEREYRYPMYEQVAPVPCDLTNSCDVFCRQDSDCDESQKLSFEHSKPVENCNGFLSPFDCNCDRFDRPEWLSVFCYVHINPVYLGKFYKTPKKIEKFTTVRNHVSKERHFNNQNEDKEIKTKVLNKYGSPVMTFVPVSDSFPSVNPLMIKTALKDSSYACKSTPVSFGVNQSSVCYTKVDEDSCENLNKLSIFQYLVQDSNYSSYNMPVVLRDLEILKGIPTEVSVKCIELKSTIKKFKKQDRRYFHQGSATPCSHPFTKHTVLVNNSCQNVLVYVQHEFILNGSDVVKLKVEYGLGDVPLLVDYDGDSVMYKYNYLKQEFSVGFFDVMVKFSDEGNFSRNDEMLNRGYFVGEELNFGYKSVKNNSTTWSKGSLGVFKNVAGGFCDSSPVTFGFNHFSVCHVRMNFSNCSELRKTAEEKLDSLLKGDSLAVYKNLRPPYNNSLPVLRSYKIINGSSETCEVPTVQDVLIQYTSTPTTGGRLVHRVLGVRVDRFFQNFDTLKNLSLTSRVSFLFVSSFREKRTSRFWKRMSSPEQSDNSWLNIFNAFDDVTVDEREEITFWWILLLGSMLAVGVLERTFAKDVVFSLS